MHVAPALVIGVRRHVEEAVLVILAAGPCGGGVLTPAAVITSARVRSVMLPAILEGDAEHPTSARSDHALHDEQEQDDELEKRWRHRVGVYRPG